MFSNQLWFLVRHKVSLWIDTDNPEQWGFTLHHCVPLWDKMWCKTTCHRHHYLQKSPDRCCNAIFRSDTTFCVVQSVFFTLLCQNTNSDQQYTGLACFRVIKTWTNWYLWCCTGLTLYDLWCQVGVTLYSQNSEFEDAFWHHLNSQKVGQYN